MRHGWAGLNLRAPFKALFGSTATCESPLSVSVISLGRARYQNCMTGARLCFFMGGAAKIAGSDFGRRQPARRDRRRMAPIKSSRRFPPIDHRALARYSLAVSLETAI